jgi:hypothetical protein
MKPRIKRYISNNQQSYFQFDGSSDCPIWSNNGSIPFIHHIPMRIKTAS